MTGLVLLACVLVTSLILGMFFTGMETATLALNRVDIHSGHSNRTQRVRDAYQMLSRTRRMMNVAVTGHVICCTAAALATHALLARLAFPSASHRNAAIWDDLAVVLVLTPVYLLLSVIYPHEHFRKHPHSPVLLYVTGPLLWVCAILLPPVHAASALTRRLFKKRHGNGNGKRAERVSSEDLRRIMEARRNPGEVEAIDKRMIYGIFDLEQTIVREIMQPLVNVVAVPRDQVSEELIYRLARESGYSRIPVYSHRVVNIDGVVNVLALLRANRPANLDEFIRTPYYVPETMRADKLMRKMVRDHVDMAIVVDEFGGTVGLVTQEDVIEEIVGEIEDEFDPMRPAILAQPDGSYLVDARMDIDDLNDRFSLTLPNEDYDTLGGFIYDNLGRIPRVGDTVENPPLRVEVMAMDGKRIERVKLWVEPRPTVEKGPP